MEPLEEIGEKMGASGSSTEQGSRCDPCPAVGLCLGTGSQVGPLSKAQQ